MWPTVGARVLGLDMGVLPLDFSYIKTVIVQSLGRKKIFCNSVKEFTKRGVGVTTEVCPQNDPS